jgi:hypothetical protein
MTPNHGQQPPKKRAAKRKGAALRARSAGLMQPIGKRKPNAKAKPEIEPAVRIAGVSPVKRATGSLVAFSESGAQLNVTDEQAADFAAWQGRVQDLAARDPEAYAEACRSGKRL